MKLLFYCLIIFSIATSLSSCIYSDQPLSSRVFNDDRLCGKWHLTDKKTHEETELTISRDKNNWYKFINKEHVPADKKDHTFEGRFYPTITKSGNFLNVEYLLSPTQENSTKTTTEQKFMLFKYSVSKNTLSLWWLNDDQLARDINAKKLKGDIDDTTWGRTIHISDSTTNILNYLNSTANNAPFKLFGNFKRLH